jgi:pimeloyl-ACP methyl ester carboxylesterase
VCRQLGVSKIALLGVSDGSIVGLHMVRQRPELFAAFVGSGQFVDWAKQDALSYVAVLDQARATGNAAAVADLERIGPPPYADSLTDMVKSRYAGAFTPAESAEFARHVQRHFGSPALRGRDRRTDQTRGDDSGWRT